MKILFSILLNSAIFFAISYILTHYRSADSITVGVNVWQTYLVSGIILGVLNISVKPILKILGIPFSLFFSSIVVFVINTIMLLLIDFIINSLFQFEGISYKIHGFVNFAIAVAIFTIMNMLYSILFNKR